MENSCFSYHLTDAVLPQPLVCSLPTDEFGRVKVIIKLVGWDKDNKAKDVHPSKATQGISSPLPVVKEVFSHHQESRAPSHVTETWKEKTHEHTPSFFFSLVLYAKHDALWSGCDQFDHLGSAVLTVFPPHSLCTPSC